MRNSPVDGRPDFHASRFTFHASGFITLEQVARLGYSLASLPLFRFFRHPGDSYEKPHSTCVKGGAIESPTRLCVRVDPVTGHLRGGPTAGSAQARAAHDIG